MMCRFKQKLQLTQGMVDANNVEIKYSLRPMT